jgi:hypothetical protein
MTKPTRPLIEIDEQTARNFGPQWHARFLMGETYHGGDRNFRLRDTNTLPPVDQPKARTTLPAPGQGSLLTDEGSEGTK